MGNELVEEQLGQALAMTFPASDPIAITPPQDAEPPEPPQQRRGTVDLGTLTGSRRHRPPSIGA